jgi:hypothetical protein
MSDGPRLHDRAKTGTHLYDRRNKRRVVVTRQHALPDNNPSRDAVDVVVVPFEDPEPPRVDAPYVLPPTPTPRGETITLGDLEAHYAVWCYPPPEEK